MNEINRWFSLLKVRKKHLIKSFLLFVPFSFFTLLSGFGLKISQYETLANNITRYNMNQSLSEKLTIHASYANNDENDRLHFLNVINRIESINSTVEQRGSFKFVDMIGVFNLEYPSLSYFENMTFRKSVNLVPMPTFSSFSRGGVTKFEKLDFYLMFQDKNANFDLTYYSGICNITIDYANQILDQKFSEPVEETLSTSYKYDVNMYKENIIDKALNVTIGDQTFRWKISNIMTSTGLLYQYSTGIFEDFITILDGQIPRDNQVLDIAFFTSNSLFLNLRRIEIIRDLFSDSDVTYSFVQTGLDTFVGNLNILNNGYNNTYDVLSIVCIVLNIILFIAYYLFNISAKNENLIFSVSTHIISNIILYFIGFMLNVLFGSTLIFNSISLVVLMLQMLVLCLILFVIRKGKEHAN